MAVILLGIVRVHSQPPAMVWTEHDGHRYAELKLPPRGETGFKLLSAGETGVEFRNHVSDDRSIRNRNLLSGSGVAAGDIDGDGWCDLFFCGLDADNALYRNLGGWQFEEVTKSAGVACPGADCTGTAMADYDGDGDLDLFVNVLGGGTRLFRNDGSFPLTEVTTDAGLSNEKGANSLALADIDGDGDLDVYVTHVRPVSIKDRPRTRFRFGRDPQGDPYLISVDGIPATSPEMTNRFVLSPSGQVLEYGEEDDLFLNTGDGSFRRESFTGGRFRDADGELLAAPPLDWGLAAQFRDVNLDHAPDLYVCNDLFTPDRFWINDGRGNFRAADYRVMRHTSLFTMGVDFADVDRDGDMDFYTVDMLSMDHRLRHLQVGTTTPTWWPVGSSRQVPQLYRNVFQINQGDLHFLDTAYFSGIEATEWSWGPVFLDVDLDGYPDILVPNGQLRDFQNADMARMIESIQTSRVVRAEEMVKLSQKFPRLMSPNLAFHNQGDNTFRPSGKAWGFATPVISQGIALADLDNDGDLDVALNNLLSEAGLFRNLTTRPRLAVRLAGSGANTRGIGARIRVTGGPIPQSEEVLAGGRYLSSDAPIRTFAASESPESDHTIEVFWRSGKVTRLTNARANRLYEIREDGPTASPSPSKAEGPSSGPFLQAPPESPLFEDWTDRLDHRHVENSFNDFERQPLLPNRFSQAGPGVCWHDFNGDGWDDLVVGSGRGGALAFFLNDGQGHLAPGGPPDGFPSTERDHAAILGLGNLALVAYSNYESASSQAPHLRVHDLAGNRHMDVITEFPHTIGPLTLGDIDGDDDLDLFVGGMCVPGRWPVPATSLLLRNDQGRLVEHQRFASLGRVQGACFSDLNGNGRLELILACDWDAIRIFQHNDDHRYCECTREWGLASFRGRWNDVAVVDLNNDGKPDLVAANWGSNQLITPLHDHPLHLYYGDLSGNGVVDIVESYFNRAMEKEVPVRGFKSLGSALPFLHATIPNFKAYGEASLADLLGPRLQQAEALKLTTLRSMVFLNQGATFQAHPLPAEAQYTPAMGIAVADFDGDGNEDIFLSQNFFAVHPEAHRQDAGLGLWLRGDGKGHLAAVPPPRAGIEVFGEQRGVAVSDFDQDGRPDLVVTQNGEETRLFHNLNARPGLRVRLHGPAGNPLGIGARIRLQSGNQIGPARDIVTGPGRFSQSSPVVVLGSSGPPDQIRVEWPGGRKTIGPIPAEALEVWVDYSGRVVKVK